MAGGPGVGPGAAAADGEERKVRKLTLGDISDLRAYEREREEFRRHIIGMKKRRRVQLGELLTVVFENTETMRFQIQEMARAERMLTDAAIAHEVATYNELIPDDGELSATLLVELTSEALLREWLPRLVGIQDHLVIDVDGAESRSEDRDPSRLTREDEITTTVHYVRFTLDRTQRSAFADGPVHITVDHPEYRARVELDADRRRELAGDLDAPA